MKYALIILLLLTNTFSYKRNADNTKDKCGCDDKNTVVTGKDGDRLISWSNRKCITWDCYQGEIPDSLKSHDAVTCVKISPSNLKIYDDSLCFNVICFFVCEKSGKNLLKITNALFIHEMKHFDLAEVCTRKLRKELTQYISMDAKSTQSFLEKTFVNYTNKLVEDATEYDLAVNYSIDSLKQVLWNKKIDSLLNVYKDYSNPHIVIKKTWK